VLVAIAEWEGDIISERTRDALAAKVARGERLGGTPADKRIPPEIAARVVRTYETEGSYAGAARKLNEMGVPTVIEDARWHPTTVAKVVRRE
jgi:DNA invertase Pin-like site-specific DNA recombinase